MKNRKMLILAVSLFLATILFTFVTFKPQAQSNIQQQDEAPTVVKKGQVTEKERGYSREYEKLYKFLNFRNRKLTEIKKPNGLGVVIGPPQTPALKNAPIINANQFLERLSCQADAVVVGRVRDKASHLSADETFVFTTYDFEIKRVIKNNPTSPIQVDGSIEATRPGGLIKIDNQLIKFDDSLYEPLKRNREYLLFLKFVTASNGYKVFDSKSDFLLENNVVKRLSKQRLPKDLNDNLDTETFLNTIQDTVSANCTQYLNGGDGNE